MVVGHPLIGKLERPLRRGRAESLGLAILTPLRRLRDTLPGENRRSQNHRQEQHNDYLSPLQNVYDVFPRPRHSQFFSLLHSPKCS